MTLIPALSPFSHIRDNYLLDFLYMNYFIDFMNKIDSKQVVLEVLDNMSKRISSLLNMEFDYFNSFTSRDNIVASAYPLYPDKNVEGINSKVFFIGRQKIQQISVSKKKEDNMETEFLSYIKRILNSNVYANNIRKIGVELQKAADNIHNILNEVI